MAEPVQTLRNHRQVRPAFHYFVLPVLLVNALNSIRHVWLDPSRHTGWELVVAVALLTFALMTRTMILTVQDRVIRLEMRTRLLTLLPEDLHSKINALSYRQLIALRFASDEELPGLVRDCLEGRLQTGKEIKERVKNWQADWLRA